MWRFVPKQYNKTEMSERWVKWWNLAGWTRTIKENAQHFIVIKVTLVNYFTPPYDKTFWSFPHSLWAAHVWLNLYPLFNIKFEKMLHPINDISSQISFSFLFQHFPLYIKCFVPQWFKMSSSILDVFCMPLNSSMFS